MLPASSPEPPAWAVLRLFLTELGRTATAIAFPSDRAPNVAFVLEFGSRAFL